MSTPMHELDALIAGGWGNVPQTRIPPDWRTRKPKRSEVFDREADSLDRKHVRKADRAEGMKAQQMIARKQRARSAAVARNRARWASNQAQFPLG